MPQTSNRSKGLAYVAEEKETGYGKIEGGDVESDEAVESHLHKRNTLHDLVGQCSYGPQVLRKMEDKCGLHRSKQGMPKRCLPTIEY